MGRYLDALSFLSRLVVRPGQTAARFQDCLPAFAPAGATLGLIWTALALAAWHFAATAGVPSVFCSLVPQYFSRICDVHNNSTCDSAKIKKILYLCSLVV